MATSASKHPNYTRSCPLAKTFGVRSIARKFQGAHTVTEMIVCVLLNPNDSPPLLDYSVNFTAR